MNIVTSDDLCLSAAQVIVHNLAEASGKNLLLLSGGSAVDIETCNLLGEELSRHEVEINFGLVDERYSKNPNHMHSNAREILESESFVNYLDVSGAQFTPMISGTDCEEESQTYQHFIGDALNKGVSISAIIGMGEDMHTAGILPNSLAAKNESDLVTCYNSGDKYDTRITATPKMFDNFHHVFIYLKGEAKREILTFLNKQRNEFHHDTVAYPALNVFRAEHQTVITDLKL